MKEKLIKVWITKYPMTRGILCVDAKISGEMATFNIDHWTAHAHGDDWHYNEKEAKAKAEDMKAKKISSLKKKITKLEGLEF